MNSSHTLSASKLWISLRDKEKARSNATWPLVKVCLRTDNSLLSYFEYPCVELADVEDIASFFCAQAPKLKALAKTATIMIAFKNFN